MVATGLVAIEALALPELFAAPAYEWLRPHLRIFGGFGVCAVAAAAATAHGWLPGRGIAGALLLVSLPASVLAVALLAAGPGGPLTWGVLAIGSLGLAAAQLADRPPRWRPVPVIVGFALAGNGALMVASQGAFARAVYDELADAMLPFGAFLVAAGACLIVGETLGRRHLALAATGLAAVGLLGLVATVIGTAIWTGVALYWTLALFLVASLAGDVTVRRAAIAQLALVVWLGTWILASHMRDISVGDLDALVVHASLVLLAAAWLVAEVRPRAVLRSGALAAVALALAAADALGLVGAIGGAGPGAFAATSPIDTGIVLLLLAAPLVARTRWPDAGLVLVTWSAASIASVGVAAVQLLLRTLGGTVAPLLIATDLEPDHAFLLLAMGSSLGILAWQRALAGRIRPRIYAALASALVMAVLTWHISDRALSALVVAPQVLQPSILAVATRVRLLLLDVLVVALVGMATVITWQIVRPIEAMIDVARRRAAGDRIPYARRGRADEIGTLSQTLGAAVAARDAADERTNRERERIQLILDNAPIMLYALDENGVFTLSEGSGLATLGLQPGQAVGQSAFDLFAGVPASLDPVRSALAGVGARTTIRGSGWVFDATHYPVRDAAGRVSGIVGVAIDVSERESAQARLLLLESAVEHGTDAILITAADGDDPVIQYLNPAFESLTGLAAADLVGRPFSRVRSVIVPDAARSARRRAAVARGEAFDSEVELRREGGSTSIADVRFAPIRDSAGRVVSLVSRWRDITERKRAERMLERRAAHLSSVVERSLDAIVAVDDAGLIVDWNPEAEALFGWPRADVLGLQAAELIIPPMLREGRGVGFEPYLGASPGGVLRERERITTDAIDRHGRVFPVEIVASQHEADDGSTIVTAFFRDVSERERHEDELEHLALYDTLTDLPNRALVADRWQIATAVAQRDGTLVGLVLLDLDQFKSVNDALGHAAGDQLLIEVGRRLRAAVGDTDTVGRLGGDEFVAVLAGLHAPGDAETIAATLLDALGRPIEIESRTLAVTASAGVVVGRPPEESFAESFRKADIAMYEVKRRGGDGAAAYSASVQSETIDRVTLGADLRAAIDGDRLRLVYQPVIDAASGAVLEVEALVRWDDPRRGPIPPAEFVAAAERSGLIISLGHWVLERALDDFERWRAAGLDLGVHVNVSVRQLGDGVFVGALLDELRRRGVPPPALTVELTESLLVRDSLRVGDDLVRLREAGVRISLDDFGTGYSSIGYLQHLPLDEIKLDRSVTVGAVDSPHQLSLLRAAREIARALGLAFVAEGVEDERTWDAVASLGDARAQGFGIGRPMPAGALTGWVAEHRRRVTVRLARRRAIAIEHSLRAAARLRDVSASPRRLDDVLLNLWHELDGVVPFDRIGVALLEDEGRTLRARWAKATYGAALRISRGYSAPMAGSSLEDVLRTHRPRIIGDLAEYLAQKPSSLPTRLMVDEGVRSSLTCPLTVGSAAVGFMFFSCRAPHAYEDAHVAAFQSIAELVADAVAHSSPGYLAK